MPLRTAEASRRVATMATLGVRSRSLKRSLALEVRSTMRRERTPANRSERRSESTSWGSLHCPPQSPYAAIGVRLPLLRAARGRGRCRLSAYATRRGGRRAYGRGALAAAGRWRDWVEGGAAGSRRPPAVSAVAVWRARILRPRRRRDAPRHNRAGPIRGIEAQDVRAATLLIVICRRAAARRGVAP